MVIYGFGAESRPAWTRMVAVVYGSEGGELGFRRQLNDLHSHD